MPYCFVSCQVIYTFAYPSLVVGCYRDSLSVILSCMSLALQVKATGNSREYVFRKIPGILLCLAFNLLCTIISSFDKCSYSARQF